MMITKNRIKVIDEELDVILNYANKAFIGSRMRQCISLLSISICILLGIFSLYVKNDILMGIICFNVSFLLVPQLKYEIDFEKTIVRLKSKIIEDKSILQEMKKLA